MEWILIQKARQIAESYNHNLRADDPRFLREVTLIFDDRTFLHYGSAFLLRIRGEWIGVFTEHHGVHVYNESDLFERWELERRRSPVEEMSK